MTHPAPDSKIVALREEIQRAGVSTMRTRILLVVLVVVLVGGTAACHVAASMTPLTKLREFLPPGHLLSVALDLLPIWGLPLVALAMFAGVTFRTIQRLLVRRKLSRLPREQQQQVLLPL